MVKVSDQPHQCSQVIVLNTLVSKCGIRMPLWRSGILSRVIAKILEVAPIQHVSFLLPLLIYIVVHFKRVDSSLHEFIRLHLLQHFTKKANHFVNVLRFSLFRCPLQDWLSILVVPHSKHNQFLSPKYLNTFWVYFRKFITDQCLFDLVVGLQDTQCYLLILPDDTQLVALHVPMAAFNLKIPTVTVLMLL